MAEPTTDEMVAELVALAESWKVAAMTHREDAAAYRTNKQHQRADSQLARAEARDACAFQLLLRLQGLGLETRKPPNTGKAEPAPTWEAER